MRPLSPVSEPTLPAHRHLPVEVLRRYVAGTLPLAEQHRVEAHTLACSRCADVLEGLELQPATVTDASLAELRQRLGSRVAELAAEQPKAAPSWMWPQLAAAAALLLTLGAAVLWFTMWRPGSRPEVASRPATVQQAATDAPVPMATPEAEAPAPAAAPGSGPDVAAVMSSPAEPVRSLPQRSAGRTRLTNRPAMQANAEASADKAGLESDAGSAASADEGLQGRVAGVAVTTDTVAAEAKDRQPQYVAAAPAPSRASSMMNRSAAPAKRKMTAEVSAPQPVVADQQLVKGRITDRTSGEGLPGVTVLAKGTDVGTITAADGSFALIVPTTVSRLTINSIGYTPQEAALPSNNAPLALALAPDTKALSEVVVVRRDAPPAPMAVGATPAGGYPALRKYLRDSLDYPEKALERHIEGNVKLRFRVEADGKISNIEVVRRLSEECDAEAVRLLQEGPSWFPAIQGGRRTARTVELTVPFKIEER